MIYDRSLPPIQRGRTNETAFRSKNIYCKIPLLPLENTTTPLSRPLEHTTTPLSRPLENTTTPLLRALENLTIPLLRILGNTTTPLFRSAFASPKCGFLGIYIVPDKTRYPHNIFLISVFFFGGTKCGLNSRIYCH